MQLVENSEANYDEKQYLMLKDRFIDETSRIGILKIATMTQPSYEEFNTRRFETLSWKDALVEWAQDGTKHRKPGRYFNEPSLAEKIEIQLDKYFRELDEEAATKPTENVFLQTSVSLFVFTNLYKCRNLCQLVEFQIPSGNGKTESINHYQRECRKHEQFNSPIWIVTLNTTNVNIKSILFEIANQIQSTSSSLDRTSLNESMTPEQLSRFIKDMATKQNDGLLIIDEAQRISKRNGFMDNPVWSEILNLLRDFNDLKLFGVALMSNGENHARAKKGNASPQIYSRIMLLKPCKLIEDDIDALMQAYAISGRKERQLCVKVGLLPGGFRNIINAIKTIRFDGKPVNYDSLSYYLNE